MRAGVGAGHGRAGVNGDKDTGPSKAKCCRSVQFRVLNLRDHCQDYEVGCNILAHMIVQTFGSQSQNTQWAWEPQQLSGWEDWPPVPPSLSFQLQGRWRFRTVSSISMLCSCITRTKLSTIISLFFAKQTNEKKVRFCCCCCHFQKNAIDPSACGHREISLIKRKWSIISCQKLPFRTSHFRRCFRTVAVSGLDWILHRDKDWPHSLRTETSYNIFSTVKSLILEWVP